MIIILTHLSELILTMMTTWLMGLRVTVANHNLISLLSSTKVQCC